MGRIRVCMLVGVLSGTTGCASCQSGSSDELDSETDSTDGGDTGVPEERDPSNVTLHRLNRTEYNNTMRDLLYGLDLRPADVFPVDGSSFGFDNIADVLSMTPILFELYERAADEVLTEALRIPLAEPELEHFEAEAVESTTGAPCCNGMWQLASNGEVYTTIAVDYPGPYALSARAYGQPAGPEPPRMVVAVDGNVVATFDVEATAAAPQTYTVETDIATGSHKLSVAFSNDFFDPMAGDRDLFVDWFEAEGPLDTPHPPNEVRANIVACDPESDGAEACAQDSIVAFSERAWRRPLADDERDRLLGVFLTETEAGGEWEDGLQLALKSSLLAPHFAFRVEIDPDPQSTEPHALGDFELASRLSYFLWSSMPDAELFDVATAGTLQDDAELEAQVARMLGDGKAEALVTNFAGQWLAMRALADVSKDSGTYPAFSESLREAMRTETELFVRTFVFQNRSMLDLLNGDRTFVNDELATHYGIELPGTDAFVEVSLADVPRRGLMTQAGLLTVLSHANMTSPVRRGKWILDQLLCTPPPPPPPEVDTSPTEPEDGETVREQLERHREDPACAGCHNLIDPLGLSLEHYDGIGGYRELDGGQPIDASGVLTDGRPFSNALELADLLAEDPNDFARCTVQKTLTYALGRGIVETDAPFIDEIAEAFAASGYQFGALVELIATSDVFRTRRGDPVE